MNYLLRQNQQTEFLVSLTCGHSRSLSWDYCGWRIDLALTWSV